MLGCPAAGVGSYEVENIMSSGQGKLPLEVVTDNNLLRQRYENDELEGKLPLYVTSTSAQVVGKFGDQDVAFRSAFGDTIGCGAPIAAASCTYPDSLYSGTTISGSSCKRWKIIRDSKFVRVLFTNVVNNNTLPSDSMMLSAAFQVDSTLASLSGKRFTLTFGGQRVVELRPGGAVLSDPLPVRLFAGYEAWVITHCVGQYLPYKNQNPSTGATWYEGALTPANAAAADWTNPGTSLTTNTTAGYNAVALFGDDGVGLPYVWINGDSNNAGTGDANGANLYGKGWCSRLFGIDVPVINTSFDGRQAGNDHQYQLRYALGVTDILFPLVINDISSNVGNQTAATTMTRIISACVEMKKWAPNAHIWKSDAVPNTTSTDSWATVEGQAPLASEPQRLLINAWINDGCPINSSDNSAAVTGSTAAGVIRAGRRIGGIFVTGDAAHPIYGVINISDSITAVKANGDQVWLASYCYTTDNLGIHLNPTAAAAAAASASWIKDYLQKR